jgi:hypothetical protein
MKKSSLKVLMSLSAIALLGVAVGSCTKGNTTDSGSQASTVDPTKAVAIQISGKFGKKTLYYEKEVVDYTDFAIDTLNASNKVISTVKQSDYPSRFVYDPIDTSTVGTGKKFTVKYTAPGESVLETSILYEVRVNDLTPSSWTANKRWITFSSAIIDNTKTKTDGTHPNSFMKETNFYLGNKNSINLFPVITGVDHFGTVGTISQLSSGITVTLKDESGTALTLSDYFSAEAITALSTTGDVDFNDNKTGTFTLEFTYPTGAALSFPAIDYKLVVVDGYNVYSAKELAVMTNETDVNYKKVNDPWKAANNIPNDVQVNNVVIQNDLTINLADLPPYSVWGASALDTAPVDSSCKNTLKDYQWIYPHYLDKTHPTFTLYGNYHKVSCGTDFPYCEENDDHNGTHLAAGEVINSHVGVFGSNKISDYPVGTADDDVERSKFQFNIRDMAFTGNTGVSDDEAMKSKGGVIFIKPNSDSTITNCVLSTIFLGTVNDGTYDSPTDFRHYTNTWDSTRIHDTFSAQLFNYLYGDIVLKNCDLYKAGGPLFINQGPAINLATTSASDLAKISGSFIKVDSATSLDNYVSGTGGWFNIYNGASDYVAQLKNLDPLFRGTLAKTFLNSDQKLNLVSVNMTTGETIAQLKDGGIFGGTVIGDKDIINYQKGYSTVAEGITTAFSGGGGDAYSAALIGTDIGVTYMSQANGSYTPVFKMVGTKENFAMLHATGSTVDGLVNAASYAGGSATIDADAKTANWLGIYGFGTNGQGLSPNIATGTNNFKNWKGTNDFGLVLGLLDYKA